MDITILAVDDSLLVTELIREFFAGRGYRVLTASNGREGLAIAEREVPDIIISDVSMPAMTGWELCAAVKQRPGLDDIPFLFLTVEGEDEDLKKGIDLGAEGYLTKPFSFDELRAAVEAALIAGGRGLPGDTPDAEGTDTEEFSTKPLPEILSVFLEKRGAGTLYVERGGGGGFIGFTEGALTGARFGTATGPHALLRMMTFRDARYRTNPEPAPVQGGFPEGAGVAYVAALTEALPDWTDLTDTLSTEDAVLCLGPAYASMDITSLLDHATAGFHRAGAKMAASHSIMPAFESIIGLLKKGPTPLGALLSGATGADAVRVLAHLSRKNIIIQAG